MRTVDAEALKKSMVDMLEEDFGFTGLIREEVIKLIDNAPTVKIKCEDCTTWSKSTELLKKRLSYLSKQGTWIYKQVYDYEYWECSNCGEPWTTIEGTPKDNNMNFCPNCGADMRGDNNG